MKQRKRRDERVAHKSDRWTDADDARLKDLRALGLTIGEVADEMQRTHNGISERLKFLRRRERVLNDATQA